MPHAVGYRGRGGHIIIMAQEAIKRRLNRAIRAAIKNIDTPKGRYSICILPGNPFHIEACKKNEIRKIRIVIDEITPEDEKVVKDFILPETLCSKEIWCRIKRGFECKIL